MGYEVHIVRQNDYSNEEEVSNISIEEWLNYVASDKELDLTNGYERNLPGMEKHWNEVPGFCSWLAHPDRDIDYLPWFDYGFGCISTKNPDSETIKKMIKISLSLNAKVRGDHFEYYDETYFTNGGHPLSDSLPIPNNAKESNSNTKKSWWKFW